MSRHPAVVVDGDTAFREIARDVMSDVGIEARFVERVDEALFVLSETPVSVILLGVRPSADAGPETFLSQAQRARPEAVPVVVGAVESADSILEAGAFELLPKGATRERVSRAVRRAMQQHDMLAELARVRAADAAARPVPTLVGRSEAMAVFRERLDAAVVNDDPVLLLGERGTGRACAARLLHALSARARGPFVTLEASGAPATGGPGAFDELGVRGGTLFVRVVDAVWSQLPRADAGGFRLVVSATVPRNASADDTSWLRALAPPREVQAIRVPPLVERDRDTLLLARHFIEAIRRRNELPPIRVSPEASYLLEVHDWPGNVRELEEAIEHALTVATGGVILPAHLPDAIRRGASRAEAASPAARARRFREAKKRIVDAFERSYLEDLLAWHRGNVTTAAEQAGMLRSALQRLLRKHDLRSDAFRRGPGPKPTADA